MTRSNDMLDGLKRLAARNCSNSDVFGGGRVRCIATEDEARVVMDASDNFLSFKNETDRLESGLVSQAANIRQRQASKKSAARETTQALQRLRKRRTELSAQIAAISKGSSFGLTSRTREQLKALKELQTDLSEMQALGNTLLAIAPFRHLLGGADIPATYEIADEHWGLLATASSGLSRHYRDQLKFFCQSEALSGANNADEKRFWVQMAKNF
ncbi:MAG: hypothetical protein ACSHXB_12035 [Sulfitobacter sp.]